MELEARSKKRDIQRWSPARFQPETTTVWSFPERGAWATHDGRYRGNWSPYIPRNLLLRYTKPGDRLLDPFIGGGTTAIEAALLGRHAVTGDLRSEALTATHEHLGRLPDALLAGDRSDLLRQDARRLAIADASVQLVLLHPPYADAIRYSADEAGDLSHLGAGPFVEQLRQVAAESLRVLAPEGRCTLLIGDLRRHGRVVPLGFAAIQAFRHAGFELEELIIKRQHNTRMAKSWEPVSRNRGFLLLSHEYLAVFHRAGETITQARSAAKPEVQQIPEPVGAPTLESTETGTTVWAVPKAEMDEVIPVTVRTVFGRNANQSSVVFVRTPPDLASVQSRARNAVTAWLNHVARRVKPGTVLVVETRDVRNGSAVQPMALEVYRALRRKVDLRLQEIVVVVPTKGMDTEAVQRDEFSIGHRYLVVASRESNKGQWR